MTVYVMRNGKLRDAATVPPLNPIFGTLHIISDHMEPTINHASGRMFDSKSEFRKETRRMGCVEVGNEKIGHKPRKVWRPDKRKRREDVQKAIYQLRNGR